MRSIMAKYNYAFGYLKGFIFMDFGFAGIACVLIGIMAIPALITGATTESGQAYTLGMLIFIPFGILMLLGIWLLFKSTLKKCPENTNPLALAIWMIIAGLVACLAFAWWLIKLVFHISGGSGSGDKTVFASGYYRDGDNASCTLWSTNLNYAILKDSQGNEIEVRKHGDGNLVIDNSGNLYRPW